MHLQHRDGRIKRKWMQLIRLIILAASYLWPQYSRQFKISVQAFFGFCLSGKKILETDSRIGVSKYFCYGTC